MFCPWESTGTSRMTRIDLIDLRAISLVKNYHTWCILNVLFALAGCRVITIRYLLADVQTVQYVEDEWPLLVECIQKGVIPDVENLGDL
ncbi:hypothetical protein BDR07DRAFT_1415790 [Suillus spraguei]|nr:hypothetical protein BDR07DRAFT_1443489 [Suillus spraguei]KAG2359139.1 hypothetical protein BDR07DRAFT_1415790 [Suillus spraguei]